MRDVVITGASTGIGFATCQVLIRHGFRVVGSVRTQADADRVGERLGTGYVPLILDVTDPDSVHRAAATVKKKVGEQRLFGLVNNAGIAVLGPLAYLPLERFRLQIEINLLGVHTVTQAFLPLLGTESSGLGRAGRVVNISSVSGRLAMPFAGAYAASKFGLEGYSDSLRRELMLFGIKVILIEPRAVVTSIWDQAEKVVVQQFPNTPYDRSLRRFAEQARSEAKTGFAPEKVGELIWRALTTPRPRARYAIVPHRLVEWSIPRRLPTELLDYCIAKLFRLR
ncbi:MAG TPA: SDR family oxidoreductase [Chthoniobacterales bacterium]|nr:SDR family oxidoreductase [Chthoniobacterales bacterium]